MVFKSSPSSRKFSGDVGSTLYFRALLIYCTTSGFGLNRQHKCQFLHKQARRNRVSSTMCSDKKATIMMQNLQYSSHSRVCSRGTKYSGRHIIQGNSQSGRVVTQTFYGSSSVQALASTSSGLVCHCREQTNIGVLQLVIPLRGYIIWTLWQCPGSIFKHMRVFH